MTDQAAQQKSGVTKYNNKRKKAQKKTKAVAWDAACITALEQTEALWAVEDEEQAERAHIEQLLEDELIREERELASAELDRLLDIEQDHTQIYRCGYIEMLCNILEYHGPLNAAQLSLKAVPFAKLLRQDSNKWLAEGQQTRLEFEGGICSIVKSSPIFGMQDDKIHLDPRYPSLSRASVGRLINYNGLRQGDNGEQSFQAVFSFGRHSRTASSTMAALTGELTEGGQLLAQYLYAFTCDEPDDFANISLSQVSRDYDSDLTYDEAARSLPDRFWSSINLQNVSSIDNFFAIAAKRIGKAISKPNNLRDVTWACALLTVLNDMQKPGHKANVQILGLGIDSCPVAPDFFSWLCSQWPQINFYITCTIGAAKQDEPRWMKMFEPAERDFGIRHDSVVMQPWRWATFEAQQLCSMTEADVKHRLLLLLRMVSWQWKKDGTSEGSRGEDLYSKRRAAELKLHVGRKKQFK